MSATLLDGSVWLRCSTCGSDFRGSPVRNAEGEPLREDFGMPVYPDLCLPCRTCTKRWTPTRALPSWLQGGWKWLAIFTVFVFSSFGAMIFLL